MASKWNGSMMPQGVIRNEASLSEGKFINQCFAVQEKYLYDYDDMIGFLENSYYIRDYFRKYLCKTKYSREYRRDIINYIKNEMSKECNKNFFERTKEKAVRRLTNKTKSLRFKMDIKDPSKNIYLDSNGFDIMKRCGKYLDRYFKEHNIKKIKKS